MASTSLFLDDDLAKLRQGRYSGEEAELRRELSTRDFSLKLPGLRNALGPSIGSWLGVPALRSSRPSANGARTFHLHHSTVSKSASDRSVAKPGRVYFEISRGQASAARETAGGQLKWQPSAKSWWAPAGTGATARLAARYSVAAPPRRVPSPTARPPGRASAHQRYIERESAPARTGEGAVYSRGTIGDSTEERAAFWNEVEGRERSDGLVQCRIVAELPHELRGHPELQQQAMDKFMDTFAGRSLPAHGVIHRPDAERRPEGGGDIRNLHAHIVYHDRPCERTAPRAWEFAGRKDREARGPAWIRELRERWAGSCNSALEKVQTQTRFHAGSYADLGIEKIPQTHLGPINSAFERQGRATLPGTVNLLCEREWERRQELAESVRLSEASATWLRRLAAAEEPTGTAGRKAWRTFNERVSELDARSAVFDAAGAIARRDGDGRRARAESMRAHAARQAARGGTGERQWERISEAAGAAAQPGGRAARTDRLRARAGGSAEGRAGAAAAARDELLAAGRRPSARRLDAACRASERRLDAARLLDRRAEIIGEAGVPGKRRAGTPALPELDESGALQLRFIVGARVGIANLDEALAELPGPDVPVSERDAQERSGIEREQRRLARREAAERQGLTEALTPSFGDEAGAVAEALASAAVKAARASESSPPAPSGTALPALPELDESGALQLRFIVSARVGIANLDEALAELPGPSGPVSEREAQERSGIEREQRRLARREAAERQGLTEALTPSFGDEAGAVAEALASAAVKAARASESAPPAPSGTALPALHSDTLAELDRYAASRRRRERRRRRELRDELMPVLGNAPAGEAVTAPAEEAVTAMIRDVDSGRTAVAAARDNEGNLVVFSHPGAPPLADDARPCLRFLLGAREGIANLDEALAELPGPDVPVSELEAQERSGIEREQRRLARRAAREEEELVQHLAPLFGRDAEGFAAALAGAAGEGGGCFVRRGADGQPAVAHGAIDARLAAGSFRILLGARAATGLAEKEAAMFAGADAAPRREEARRERLHSRARGTRLRHRGAAGRAAFGGSRGCRGRYRGIGPPGLEAALGSRPR